MNALLVNGPFAGAETRVIGGDGVEPRILACRCPCCAEVAACVEGSGAHRRLEADGVIFVTYLLCRVQTSAAMVRRTVDYEVFSEVNRAEQEATERQVRELVAL